ncbi:hypothetical protein [Brevibacillus laterosporus]|uniref:hypothetical protein n=1 Tax=Brevibacillus laterosporus TaxID=1465 RepID=UPI0015963A2F|nr:hypothetical protein [Brevibacillus laterosporus]
MSSNQVLEVKIENLHRELNSFKEETKEDIRDINLSIKQSEKSEKHYTVILPKI